MIGDVSRLKQVMHELRARGSLITLITTRPHYPYGESKGFGLRLFQNSQSEGVRIVRIAMPKIRHQGFANRLILYLWFSVGAALPVLAYSKGGTVWAFSQRVFSTYSALPSRLLFRTKVISDETDVWPEALVNTGYAKDGSFTFRLGRALATFAYGRSDAISTISESLAKVIRRNYGVPESKLFVLPYVTSSGKKGEFRRNSPFTVLYYGNTGPNYDFRVVVKAAGMLESSGVEFVVRGDGVGMEWLRQELHANPLSNFKLIGQVLSQTELRDLVASADVLILPMAKETYLDASFPGKLVEFLQAGRPIAYVGKGYPAKLVSEHSVGDVIQDGDARALANFVVRVKQEPEAAARMAENGVRLATEMYPPSSLTDSIGRLLEYVTQVRR